MPSRYLHGAAALLFLASGSCSSSVGGGAPEPDATLIGDAGGGEVNVDAGEDTFVPRPCDSNVDCAGGEVCRDGTCVESCGTGDACAGTLPICDEEAGVCVGCLADTHCEGDQVCEPVSRRCVDPECVSDEDCGGGFTCDEGNCTPIDDIVCEALQSRCEGNTLLTCSRDGTREEATPCDAGDVCEDDGAGAAACRALICVPDEVACVDDFTAGLCNAAGTRGRRVRVPRRPVLRFRRVRGARPRGWRAIL